MVNRRQPRRVPNRAAMRQGAEPPNQVVVRKLHRLGNINIATTNPNGGVEHFFQLGASLDDFDAYAQLVQQYEQYRITSMKIQVRPNAQNAVGISDPINKIGACFALSKFTTAESFIDYDTATAPNQAEILRRDKVKLTRLDHDGWQTLATFSPKVRFDTAANQLPAMVMGTDWLSTDYPDLPHSGLRGVFKHDSDFWGTTATTAARITVYYTVTVEFRGLKSGV